MSVIVPVAGPAPLLGEQLAALAAQDYRGACEVVLADNDAADTVSCATRAQYWDHTCWPLRVVAAGRRPGINTARNVAVQAARGDLLAFCDGDDIVRPGWLAGLVAAAVDHDLVGGQLDETSLNGASGQRPAHPVGHLPVGLGYLPFALGANFAIWRDVLVGLGHFDERFPLGWDDAELSFRAQLHGFRLGYAPGAVVAYRHRATAAATFQQFRLYGRAEPLLYRRFRHNGMSRSTLAAVARRWASLLAPRALPRLVYRAGYSIGRLEGSVRWRSRYL